MNKAQSITSYVIKKLWLAIVTVVVLLALFIIVIRISLPYLDDYRDDIEYWVKQNYDATISISEIQAEWQHFGPALALRDVVLEQDEGSPVELNVTKIQVGIDFWQSLKSRKIITKTFNLNGAEATLNLDKINAEGENEYPIIKALQELFLVQLPRFNVSNSLLVVTSKRSQSQAIELEQLRWFNKKMRHQGVGTIKVSELTSNSLEFLLDITGKPNELSGSFYGKASQLQISPWLNQFMPEQRVVTASRLNFESWGKFSQKGLSKMLLKLSDNQVTWEFQGKEYGAQLNDGFVFLTPSSTGWQLQTSDVSLLINDEMVGLLDGYLVNNNQRYSLNLQQLPIEKLLPLTSLVTDHSTFEQLNSLSPKGEITDATIIRDSMDTVWQLEFADLGWNQFQDIPGLSGINGRIVGAKNSIKLLFESNDQLLQIDQILPSNLAYQRLSGEILVKPEADNFTIESKNLTFKHKDFNLNPSFIFDGSSGELSLFTSLPKLDAIKSLSYLPNKVGSNTRAFLNRAIKHGSIIDGELLFHGRPDDYPFDDFQGVFHGTLMMDELELAFSSRWPALTNSKVQVDLINNSLQLLAHSGKVKELEVNQALATIPRLSRTPGLIVESTIKAQAPVIRDVMQNSMLKDSVGVAMEELQISGELSGDLRLTIDLDTEDARATGQVTFVDNDIYVSSLEQSLTSVNGTIDFDNSAINSEGMSAILWNMPIGFSLVGDEAFDDYQLKMKANGHWETEDIFNQLDSKTEKFFAGTLDWKSLLEISLTKSNFDYRFHLTSDMPQIISELPEPFDKEAGEAYRLSLLVEGDKQNSVVNAYWGQQLNFRGYFPHQTKSFSRAHLSIGPKRVFDMGNGFSITAQLPQASFSEWFDVVDALTDNNDDADGFLSIPEKIELEVAEVEFLQQQFNNARMDFRRQSNYWDVRVSTDELRGDLVLNDDWLNDGLNFNAAFIRMPQWKTFENSGESEAELIRAIPPMTISCAKCEFFDVDLGRIDLELKRIDNGMHIERLLVEKGKHKLSASGDWLIDQQQTRTEVVGEVNSPEFGDVLAMFDINSGIKDSDGRLQFDLDWQGAPYAFNFAGLNGDVKWRLEEGYLSEISDQGSRLFSLFSLDSLVRKLRLDFRDVFSKGFFYNKVTADFQLANGIASTKNLKIDGLPGLMSINGYTDLVDENVDYRISFKPKVTSSIPALVAWMINPATGLAALALDEMMQSAEVVSEINYSLTGTLDNPVITELGRQSKEVALPARANPDKQNDLIQPETSDQIPQGEG